MADHTTDGSRPGDVLPDPAESSPVEDAATATPPAAVAARPSRWRQLVPVGAAFLVGAVVATVVVTQQQSEVAGDLSDATSDPETTAQAEDAVEDRIDDDPTDEPEPVPEPDLVLSSASPSSGDGFSFTFDGEPNTPTPFSPEDWDVTIHSRDASTFDALEPIEAEHGSDCGPPTDTHTVTQYVDAVFLCRDHMMTAINAEGYAMIYLTPDHMVDFSEGEAVIRLDISTLRTSARDWWDVWITPFEDNLQLPLDLDSDVDAAGPPRRAIRIGLGTGNEMQAELYEDFEPVDFGEYPENRIPGDWGTGYESFLEPDRARRDTFEIRISQDRLRVGMPDYDFWWIDHELPELSWSAGVVQFGHHSYNPTKDCNVVNNPVPPVNDCTPMTWHWDNFEISPAAPFEIVRGQTRMARDGAETIELTAPAPEDAFARFAGIGLDVRVRFDGGEWIDATSQATSAPTVEEHFTSYWMPIPPGTETVEFDADDWFADEWLVRDLSVWQASTGG